MIRLEKEATSNSLEDGERKESSTTTEASEAMRNLVLLVASLSFLGHTELPSSTVMDVASISLFQLNSFELPQPENRSGQSLRGVSLSRLFLCAF